MTTIHNLPQELRARALVARVNGLNGACRDVADPRNVLDILTRIVIASVETMKSVNALPPLEIRS